jgi:hypothetical protein
VTGERPSRPDPYVELADDAVHEAAVRTRVEERALRATAVELATWVGTLRDLAEARRALTVQLAGGRTHRGRLVAVGLDHLVLEAEGRATVLLRLAAVRVVRPEPERPAPAATGDRDAAQDRTLVEALDRLVETGRRIVLLLEGTREPLAGRLAGIGEDILTLQLDGAAGSTAYAPIGAVTEVLLDR